jgi:hypothetical protein
VKPALLLISSNLAVWSHLSIDNFVFLLQLLRTIGTIVRTAQGQAGQVINGRASLPTVFYASLMYVVFFRDPWEILGAFLLTFEHGSGGEAR